MNKGLLEAVARTKLASLVALLIFFTTGYFLIKGETSFTTPSSIGGFLSIGTGIFLGIVCVVAYLFKEHSDNVVSHYTAIISTLQTVLEAKSRPFSLKDAGSGTMGEPEGNLRIQSEPTTHTTS